MIKLIATDMDGSLLDENKQFPPYFFETMEALQQKGIIFVAASGRSYAKQKEVFEPAKTQPYFLCDNGALLMHDDEALFSDYLDPEQVHRMVDVLMEIPEIEPVFCGRYGAWHRPVEGLRKEHLSSYFIGDRVTENLHEIDEPILKVAIFDPLGSAQNSYPVMSKLFGETFHCVVSGPLWMDIMNQGVNKGRTLQALQQKLGITPSETMAFGDYYNDAEMLQTAYHSYVMENAQLDMRQYANFIAPSNEKYGVLQVISTLL